VLYCSHDELTTVLPHGILTLETRNGRIGTETVVFSDPHALFLGMSWDRDGDDETVSATFMMDGREVMHLDGDQWREFESGGTLDAVVHGLFQGGLST